MSESTGVGLMMMFAILSGGLIIFAFVKVIVEEFIRKIK